MKQICHAHCPKGGGTAGSIVIGLLVVAGVEVATSSAATRVASDLLHVLLWSVVSLVVVSAVTLGVLVTRRRSYRAVRPAARTMVAPVRSSAALPAKAPAAIPARRVIAGKVIERSEKIAP